MHPDLLGAVAGSLTTLAFLPQVIKVVRTRSTHDLSLAMFITFTTGVLLWLIYGVLVDAMPIIAANAVTLTLSGIVLIYKLRFG